MVLYHACRTCFTPLSIRALFWGSEMVEAPGTAPGSTTLIPTLVYHHSRIEMIDVWDIGFRAREC